MEWCYFKTFELHLLNKGIAFYDVPEHKNCELQALLSHELPNQKKKS